MSAPAHKPLPKPPDALIDKLVNPSPRSGDVDVANDDPGRIRIKSAAEWDLAKRLSDDRPQLFELPPVAKRWELLDPTHQGAGIRLAQFVKFLLKAAKRTGVQASAVSAAAEAKGQSDGFVTKALEAYEKALSEGATADGGVFVRPEFSAEFIPLLRARAVLSRLGIRRVPMGSPELVYAKQNSGASASYTNEGGTIAYSQAGTGDLKLSAKKLRARTAITDELLADGGPAADMFLRDDLIKVLALRSDLAGIRGDGTSSTPMGLRYATASGNVIAATQAGSVATADEVSSDLMKLITKLEEANAPMDRCGWLFVPRVKNFLMNLKFSSGPFLYKEEMQSGRLLGYPFETTTQIPKTLGGSSNESEVYFFDLDEFMEGYLEEVAITIAPYASFTNAAGSSVNGFDIGMVPVAAQLRHDFALRHTDAASVLTTVKWGA